jgi:hypothetical protein
MRRLRNIVARRDAHRWAQHLVGDALRLATQESGPTAVRVMPVPSGQHVKVIHFTGRRSDAHS